jgi:hypothetical protein
MARASNDGYAQDKGEIVWIPGGSLAFSREAQFARGIGTKEVEGEAAQEGEIVRGIA